MVLKAALRCVLMDSPGALALEQGCSPEPAAYEPAPA